MEEYRCYAGTTPRRRCTHMHTSAKDKLRPLLLTPPFVEGSNPGPFATLSTTQPLSHMWPNSDSAKVKLEMSSGELTRKQDGCLSQLSSSYIWVRRVSWAVSKVLRMCVWWTRYVSAIVCARWWIVHMLPLRHNGGYFVKYQNILLAKPTDGLMYGEHRLDDIWSGVCWSQEVYGHDSGTIHYIKKSKKPALT